MAEQATDWGWEAAKVQYALIQDARQKIEKLGQRWNDIYAQEIMHTTYAGKQSWMVPSTETWGRTERIWTDKPLAEKTTELQDVIANLGRRVDAMKAETVPQAEEHKQRMGY